jgi:hypothetical protein
MHRPDKMGSRRISQFGKDADKLAVKLFWSVLVVLRSVRDECHQSGIPANQSCRDVPVVVKTYAAIFPALMSSVPSSLATHTSDAPMRASSFHYCTQMRN